MSKIIEPYLRNLDRIKDQLEQIGQRAVKENADLIIHTLQYGQLDKGKDSEGSEIGTYARYTSLIASDPHRKPRGSRTKRAGDPYNMFWTGELFNTMTLRAERDSFSIFSTTGKDKFLEGIYGRFMKLTEENNTWINQEVILPYMQKYILDYFWRV